MKIIYGIKDGAVLQRDKNNLSKTYIKIESQGDVCTDLGKIEKQNDLYCLTGIPTGGPYELTISDDESSTTFSNIYVGDLWLLGGQSNMEGVGRRTPQDDEYDKNPEEDVRAYYFSDEWAPALTRLHIFQDSKEGPVVAFWDRFMKLFTENHFPDDDIIPGKKRCVGPGLFFGREMKKLTKVPQGLIVNAFGGAAIRDWSAENDNSFCAVACHRIELCGGYIRGLFWWQGESDAMIGTNYEEFQRQYDLIRKKLSKYTDEMIPTTQVQIATVRNFVNNYPVHTRWAELRNLQMELDDKWENIATISSVDAEIEDAIHATSDSQKVIGKRGAKAMFELVNTGSCKLPKVKSVEFGRDTIWTDWVTIIITYENAHGLHSVGVPFGYSMRDIGSQDRPTMTGFERTTFEDDKVIIRTNLTPDKLQNKEIWYCWDVETYGTIFDENGEPLRAHKITLK